MALLELPRRRGGARRQGGRRLRLADQPVRAAELSRYPPVSRPAEDFVAAARAPEPPLLPAAAPPPLSLIVRRPIHHALAFSALYRLLERLRAAAPGVPLDLWLRSALDDDRVFRSLPADRVGRLPEAGDGALAGWRGDLVGRGGCCLLVGEGEPPVAGEAPPIPCLGSLPLGYRSGGAESPGRSAAADAFFAAALAAAPRWRLAPGAAMPAPLPARPSFLVHQARSHLGDALWLTPLLRALVRRYPGASVTVVASPAAARVLSANPDVGRLLVCRPEDDGREQRRLRDALATHRFDAALFALARRPRSRWLADAAAELGVPVRINLEYFDRPRDGDADPDPFTHEGWLFWGTMPSPRFLLHTLEPLVGTRHWQEERRVELPIGEAAHRAARRRLARSGIDDAPFAVLAPGGLSSERWPPGCYATLAAALAEAHGLHVLVEGGADDRALLERVCRTVPGRLRRRVAAATDPLDVLTALLTRATLLVSNDSAPIHLAEVAGTPTLYLAQQEKLTHSHPLGPHCWALFDGWENRLAEVSPEQVAVAAAQLLGGRIPNEPEELGQRPCGVGARVLA